MDIVRSKDHKSNGDSLKYRSNCQWPETVVQKINNHETADKETTKLLTKRTIWDKKLKTTTDNKAGEGHNTDQFLDALITIKWRWNIIPVPTDSSEPAQNRYRVASGGT
jgi:hypothetical protein